MTETDFIKMFRAIDAEAKERVLATLDREYTRTRLEEMKNGKKTDAGGTRKNQSRFRHRKKENAQP